MPDIEHDMDELFQRAAENYPLKSGKGEWDAVAKKIAAEYEAAGIEAPVRNKKGRKMIYLFLLLMIGSFGWLPVKDLFRANVLTRITSETPGNNEHSPDIATILKYQPNFSAKDSPRTPEPKNEINKPGERSTMQTHALVKKINDHPTFRAGVKKAGPEHKFAGAESQIKEIDKGNALNPPPAEIKKEIENPAIDLAFVNENISGRNIKTLKDSGLLKNALKQDDDVADTNNNKKIKPALKKKKGAYLGIIAGLDYSKVRSMSFDNSGFAAGIIAGVVINSKLSFETGITWNKKNYSSEGINFSMDKVGSAMAGMVINNLKSKSSLIEVPIKIKYDIITCKKSTFHISTGVAAYIMTEEKNLYNVSFNGNDEKVAGVYKKNNYRLPAVASISLGYQYNLSNSKELRVEPFLKIPLQGVGVGSLPLTSAGLQIGIISRLK